MSNLSNRSRPIGLIPCLLLILVLDAAAVEESPVMQPPFQPGLELVGFNLGPLHLQWDLLDQFYSRRGGRTVWHDQGRLNSWGELLLQWISSVQNDGLSSKEYHLQALDFFSPLTLGKTQQMRELLLTDAYFRLAKDLSTGHFNPEEIDPGWRFSREPFDPVESLERMLDRSPSADLMASLMPAVPGYARLRDAYHRYRQIESLGGWPEISLQFTLRPGDVVPVVHLLRKRLQIEGDHPDLEPEDPWNFDAGLEEAVKRFQRRHGLQADGVVGPRTLEELNVPVDKRVQELLANMERWRWLPAELGESYLLVNTAGYELLLVLNGKTVLHKRTINGRQKRPTPSFKGRITHLVVNPTWTVPRVIAVKDLLPKQQRDPEFLTQKGIRVFQHQNGDLIQLDAQSIDWSGYHADNFPFLLRQDPGPKNSLGRVKFHMNNPYAIFLHDTPSVGLFNKPIRAFSSGCVRVQRADQLARRLLTEGGQSLVDSFDQPLQSGDTVVTKLANPISVYLTYFTSWVDEAGLVQFRPDIQQRNTRLVMALQGNQQRFAVSKRESSVESL